MRIRTSTASGLVSASGGTGRLFWLDLFPNILASVERVSRTVSRGGYLLEVPSIKEKRRRFARRRFHELFCLLTRNWWALLESNQRPPPCEGDALPLSQAPNP